MARVSTSYWVDRWRCRIFHSCECKKNLRQQDALESNFQFHRAIRLDQESSSARTRSQSWLTSHERERTTPHSDRTWSIACRRITIPQATVSVNSTSHRARFTRANFSRAWLKLQRFFLKISHRCAHVMFRTLFDHSSRPHSTLTFLALSSEQYKSLCTVIRTLVRPFCRTVSAHTKSTKSSVGTGRHNMTAPPEQRRPLL